MKISASQKRYVKKLVVYYTANIEERAEHLANVLFNLFSTKELQPHIHSIRRRTKDPVHLEDKLIRKSIAAQEAGIPFDITEQNLFSKINDLAGVRILHLHTGQFPKINEILLKLLRNEDYQIIDGPRARVWDEDYESIFKSFGILAETNSRLYSSVHYVVQTGSETVKTAEIQVRTLADELWGEVDHAINYPHKSEIISCVEQIKVLARMTSSCTRLVDSIFLSKAEAEKAAASLVLPNRNLPKRAR